MENVVAGANGGLQNVVVYLSEGLTGNEASAASSDTPTWDQKGCQYIPHVLALNPNQHFKVVNSDQTSHNVHPLPKPSGSNHEWNKSQPSGASPFDVFWTGEEIAVPVKCNIHPWMHGYMAVVKGPNAVSDANGSFSLNVPAGSYTVTAWQEEYGTQTQKVTVAAGKSATANFTFKAK
jgi:plastocyanin